LVDVFGVWRFWILVFNKQFDLILLRNGSVQKQVCFEATGAIIFASIPDLRRQNADQPKKLKI